MDIRLNFALLFTVSIIPDIDLLFFRFMVHRGATHSLLFSLLAPLPFIAVYKKRAIPYWIALLSHSLIGDIFSGGIQLFWPVSRDWIFILNNSSGDLFGAVLELSLFVVCTTVMVINKDFQKMLSRNTNKIYWLIPFGAVLGPLLIHSPPYGSFPLLLVAPSLFYLAIFSYVIIGLNHKKSKQDN